MMGSRERVVNSLPSVIRLRFAPETLLAKPNMHFDRYRSHRDHRDQLAPTTRMASYKHIYFVLCDLYSMIDISKQQRITRSSAQLVTYNR